MATRFLLDHAPQGVATKQVTFKKLTGEVTVIDPKAVDEKDADIIGRLDANQGKFKGGKECGYIQFNPKDEGTAYDLYEKSKGDVIGYFLVQGGGLIAVEKAKAAVPLFLIIIIAVIALLAVIGGILIGSGTLGKGSNSDDATDVSAASSEITIADGEPFDGTIDNGKDNTESETRFIEFPAFTTVYVQQGTTIDLVNPESNHVYFKYTILENDTVLYESDYIAPGQKYAWDATGYITGAGEHSVVFSVSTISVDDQLPRNGAEFAVTAVVS